MNKIIAKALMLSLVAVFSLGFWTVNIYAEGEEAEEPATTGTSISLEPSSKTLQINSNSVYDGSFKFKNDGDNEINIEVYAAPYSYIHSDEDDSYQLGFNNENNFTQISRWITIKNDAGEYEVRPSFKVDAKETIEIFYRITTPNDIPAGGQYAVIFAQTVGGAVSTNGIRTEASAGMIIYGHSLEGEAKTEAEISSLTIAQGVNENDGNKSNFYATAKVKNTGNVDFYATGRLIVEPIIGFGSYDTLEVEGAGIVSVIPESERIVGDEWKDTPSFGLYKITWTVTAGDKEESIERIIFIISPVVIVISIILLTIIVIWVTIGVRKRKERRARLAV